MSFLKSFYPLFIGLLPLLLGINANAQTSQVNASIDHEQHCTPSSEQATRLNTKEKFQECLDSADACMFKTPNKARGLLEQAIGMLESKPAPFASDSLDILRMKTDIKRGICCYLLGNIDSAIIMYNKSREMAEKIYDTIYIIRNINNLAICHMDMCRYDEAIDNYLTGLELAKKQGHKLMIATFCNNISAFYSNNDNFKDINKALRYRREGLKICLEVGDKEKIADNYANFGSIYKDTLSDSAMYYVNLAIPIYKEIGDIFKLSQTYVIAGNIHKKLNDYDKALEYFKLAVELDEKSGNTINIANHCSQISQLYLIMSKKIPEPQKSVYINQAYSKALKAFDASQKTQNPASISESAAILATIDSMRHNYKDAFKYLQICTRINDSIRSQKLMESTFRVENRYMLERNQALENEKLVANKLMRSQRTTLMIVVIGLVLLAIMLVLLYRRMILVSRQRDMITHQKEEIESQRKEILSSINYARHLQEAVLPSVPEFSDGHASMFVLYSPRDIVSGDFYWFFERGDTLLLAVADCTGHGVPGACLSMLGLSYMRELSVSRFDSTPAQMLDIAREMVIKDLGQTGNIAEQHDGMDISVCRLNRSTNELQFASAHNPLFVVPKAGEPYNIKGDRQPVSFYKIMTPFTNQTVQLQPGDTFYMMSDGLKDLFSEDGRKFTYKRLKDLLIDMNDIPLQQQQVRLSDEIRSWRGDRKQIDDITLLGFRV